MWGGSTGVCFFFVNQIEDPVAPGGVQLIGAVAAKGFRIASGGGIADVEVFDAVDVLIAQDGDQMAGRGDGGVFHIGETAAFFLSVVDGDAHGIALCQLLTDQVEAAVLDVAVVTEGSGCGKGEGPVAKALIIEVVVHQCHLLREKILAPVV